MNKFDLMNLALVFQKLQIVEKALHHLKQLVLTTILEVATLTGVDTGDNKIHIA
jgi:hypothetical protein